MTAQNLLVNVEDNSCKLRDNSLKLLGKYHDKKCLFVGVFGKCREGKSYFLNCLCHLQKEESGEEIGEIFPVGYGDKSITKGIFISTVPIRRVINGEEVYIFFLDSQGLFATDIKKKMDNLIVSLILSLCHIVLYNVCKRPSTYDLELIKLNIHLGVCEIEVGKANDKSFVIVCRDRPPKKNHKWGYFNEDIRDEYEKEHSGFLDLSRNFSSLSVSLFPEPSTQVKGEEFTNHPADAGAEFWQSMLNFGNDFESLLLYQVKHSKTGNEMAKDIRNSFSSINANSRLMDENTKVQLMSLVDIEQHLSHMLVKMKKELGNLNPLKEKKDREILQEEMEKIERKYQAEFLKIIEHKQGKKLISDKDYNDYKEKFEKLTKELCLMKDKDFSNTLQEFKKQKVVLEERCNKIEADSQKKVKILQFLKNIVEVRGKPKKRNRFFEILNVAANVFKQVTALVLNCSLFVWNRFVGFIDF